MRRRFLGHGDDCWQAVLAEQLLQCTMQVGDAAWYAVRWGALMADGSSRVKPGSAIISFCDKGLMSFVSVGLERGRSTGRQNFCVIPDNGFLRSIIEKGHF